MINRFVLCSIVLLTVFAWYWQNLVQGMINRRKAKAGWNTLARASGKLQIL